MGLRVSRQLPESSRRILVHVADMLRDGFTGRIELDCSQGGIRNMTEIRSFRPAEIPDKKKGDPSKESPSRAREGENQRA